MITASMMSRTVNARARVSLSLLLLSYPRPHLSSAPLVPYFPHLFSTPLLCPLAQVLYRIPPSASPTSPLPGRHPRLFFFFLMKRPPPRSTLFPYPTLFRSTDRRRRLSTRRRCAFPHLTRRREDC